MHCKYYKYELYHHGIRGQAWGKTNGPPYPLDDADHSAKEKRMGWRKSLDKDSPKVYNKNNRKNQNEGESASGKRGLTDNQKRAIIIGASAAAAALAAYGMYRLKKSGKLDELINGGKSFIESKFGKQESSIGGYKKLKKPETVEEALKNSNPTHGSENCYKCVVASALRMCGLDVTATEDEAGRGETFDQFGKVFRLNPDNGKDVVYVGSPTVERFERNILKRYKEGDIGAIGFQWDGMKLSGNRNHDPGGHTINWIIQNGKVRFFDTQNGTDDGTVRNTLTRGMNNNLQGSFARFANVHDRINADNIAIDLLKQYVR